MSTQQPCCGPLLSFSNNPAPAHCWVLTAAIIMQKLPGSVKLTCPENLCHIRRRLENWKHKDLPSTGYIYNLYSYICFCAPTILEFWAEKGGGVDQIQKFLGTFYLDFGEIRPKKVPQKFQKKISLQKSVPKVPKVKWGGGGGSTPFWKNSIIKLHFFYGKLPKGRLQKNH